MDTLSSRTPSGRLVRAIGLAILVLLSALALSIGLDTIRQRLAGPPVPALALNGRLGQAFGRGIDGLQARASQYPNDPVAHLQLGQAYLQKARETADPTYYARAESALTKANSISVGDPEILVARGTLALARHQFAEALALGEQARALNPRRASAHGVIGDALIELGRYDEAFDAFQTMVDLRPDLTSYARVSYARELQGDLAGAIEAMRLAASAGATAGEAGAWTRIQLGHLLLQTGAVGDAEREYRWAAAADPTNMLALAGLGRARIAAGDLIGAIPYYEQATERMPLPELVLTLGELYEATGRPADANQQFGLARVLQTLIVANGGNIDLELALFEAERGDPARAVELARAEVGRRSSIYVYDALAWALYNSGDHVAARDASRQALRLGTDDALMLYHAAMIDLSLGDRDAACDKLGRVLARNPAFSVRHAPEARRLLLALEATK